MVLLPRFSLLARQPDPPHRKRVIARHADATGIVYTVATNWPRTRFFLSAAKNGFRMSNTLATSTAAKGERWRAAVEQGDVEVRDTGPFGKVDVTKNFRRQRKRAPSSCAAGSYRAKKTKSGHLLTFCCPKGKWNAKRKTCKVAMELQSIGHRRR
jgi:hypothetical protein